MKKAIAILTALIISLISAADALAYTYPQAFWGLNSAYSEAEAAKNYSDIIKYGTQIIDLMKNQAEGQEKKDIMITRYNAVALAYAELGDYENSAATFRAMISYGEKYGDEYFEYLKGAKVRSEQYESDIRIFTDNGTPVYYGAKNEHQNGIVYGLCYDGAARSQLVNESALLVYQEFGQALVPYNRTMISEAASSGLIVEYALNCPNEGLDIENIQSKTSSLREVSDLIGKYPSVPFLLRFGAEMDVWERHPVDPEAYKEAFRFVSQYFRSRNSNVAMVWSPNCVAGWYTDIDDYYPGDEYVDWVGMSLYMQKYFRGDKNTPVLSEIAFRTGINSEPVIMAKDIIERYGDRKPIMISESGCGHYVKTVGEDSTDYAVLRLRQYLSYLPMLYPQVKAIFYFDHYGGYEPNDFSLGSSQTLANEFARLTSGARFIQDKYYNDTDFCYREVKDGTNISGLTQLSCYTHKYNDVIKSVTYYIDGAYAGMSNQIPFTTYANLNGYSGQHILKAVAEFESGQTLTKETTVNIGGGGNLVSVQVNGKKISFEENPVIYNGRTMVPMRKIFEELGAMVSWDGNTKTATGTLGDITVKITDGSSVMYVDDAANTSLGEPARVVLDSPAFVLNGTTLVPVRAIAEGLGCGVDWDGASYTVKITSAK